LGMGDGDDLLVKFSGAESAEEVWGDGDLFLGDMRSGPFPKSPPANASAFKCHP
jgi:hypothetical protein